MKKLVMLLVSVCLISLIQGASGWPNPDKPKEKWEIVKSAPSSPVGRRNTDSSRGSLSVSPKKVAAVPERKAYDVQFEDSGDRVEVPFEYPFANLKVMTQGIGALRHRFDPVHMRGNGAQSLKDLMAFYDNPSLFVARFYSDQQSIDLDYVIYLAGLLGAENFANKLYVALLNHPNNQGVFYKKQTTLNDVFNTLNLPTQMIDMDIALQSADERAIIKYNQRTEYSQMRQRARALFRSKFG